METDKTFCYCSGQKGVVKKVTANKEARIKILAGSLVQLKRRFLKILTAETFPEIEEFKAKVKDAGQESGAEDSLQSTQEDSSLPAPDHEQG